MAVVLHQFRYSHYNDKARWALAWKGVEHARLSYLPGPHMRSIQRLSGQRQTPVLVWDDEVIAGSDRIVDALESRVAERPLLPVDAAGREAVARWRREFDGTVGPAVRTVVFAAMIDQGGFVCRLFAEGEPLLKRAAYRATFPVARGLIARANGVADPDNVRRSEAIVESVMAQVAEATAATGQLVGDAFSAADLTAAALLAPLVNPAHPDMNRPRPMPPALDALVSRWQSHPGGRWVLDQYARHRPGG